MNDAIFFKDARDRIAKLEREKADQGLTLVTLCDMVIGENAADRSDAALVRAVSRLKRENDDLWAAGAPLYRIVRDAPLPPAGWNSDEIDEALEKWRLLR